jgi:hypothetical protein
MVIWHHKNLLIKRSNKWQQNITSLGNNLDNRLSFFITSQDILITKYDFQTLMDVVIVDSIHTNMVQRASTMITHAVMMAIQEEDMIMCWVNTKRWLHSLCDWNIWMFSFLFWFIFYLLCINHYHTSLMILIPSMVVYYYKQRVS